MLIGTAGHIDHGKTSLVRRLTGKDTDRLPEEKRRGISIELGYAYVPVAADDEVGVLGFIDVPGHERFVHTMLAGATGIDLALLVVAADDGVMPQTDEHLDILLQLGITRGVIALTKIDAVDAARRAAVEAQLASRLRGTPAAHWPVFPVSSVDGTGVEALGAHLREQAARFGARSAGGNFRMAIDRSFTLPGIGTIVAGTVHAGRVAVGDLVEIVPGPQGRRVSARVRSLHAQDRAAASGVAGQRCALNLAGIEKADAARGDWLQAAGLDNLTTRFDATLALATQGRALQHLATVHLHHGAEDVLARVAILEGDRIEPGASALVCCMLDRPIAACKGDRFVIRDASATQTLGGGMVLDIASPVRGKRAAPRLAWLRALRDEAVEDALARGLAPQPLALARLRSGWNLTVAEHERLLTARQARVTGDTAFGRDAWAALCARAIAAVTATHEREPEMAGTEQQRLRRIVAPGLSTDVFAALVDELLADGKLVRRGAFLAAPGHRAELGKDERVRWERLKPLLMAAPFGPPRVRDLARDAGMSEAEVRALLRHVARVGEVALVAQDHFFLASAVAQMADIAAELVRSDGAARAAAFRDRIGGGRKVAIHVLEFFDRVGYTRRVRDDHVLRRSNPWRADARAVPAATPAPLGAGDGG
jgi:selenocysteine-specific elongation factor